MGSVGIETRFFEILQNINLSSQDILSQYEQTCLSHVQTLSQSIDQNSNTAQTEIEKFIEKKQNEINSQESETWLLLNMLLQGKTEKQESHDISHSKVGFNCSKKSLAFYLQDSNTALKKSFFVKEWLQWIYLRNQSQLIDRNFNFSRQSMWSLENN